MSLPLEEADHIAGLANGSIGEPEIGRLLGEMYEVLGPYGSIVIQPYSAADHDRVYYEGTRFPGRNVSLPAERPDALYRRARRYL